VDNDRDRVAHSDEQRFEAPQDPSSPGARHEEEILAPKRFERADLVL
jgi:hypothetical protein